MRLTWIVIGAEVAVDPATCPVGVRHPVFVAEPGECRAFVNSKQPQATYTGRWYSPRDDGKLCVIELSRSSRGADGVAGVRPAVAISCAHDQGLADFAVPDTALPRSPH